MTVVDRIREQAASRPDHPAILVGEPDGMRSISYAELADRFDRIATRLRAAGVAPGDRCGLVARQGASFVEAGLGVLAAGGCLVPIPDDHGGAALESFAESAALHFLIEESADFEPRPQPSPRAVDGVGDEAFRALEPAYLRFTSGTTSERKGVILGHTTIDARLAAANRGLGIGPDDRILWLLPMAHHFVVSILLYLRFGATILLPASSLARPVLELAQREGATVFYASPYHVNLLAKDESDLALPALRLAISTAEGIREEVAARFSERFGHPVGQALGIIEVGLPVVNLHAAKEKPLALGRPLPDYDVWLRREDGSRLSQSGPDSTGEICVRGPGMLDAYLDPWLPAAQVLEPDGFRTGDQGWFDADGELFLAGRRTNRINMAGMKFFSEEVESVIETHPLVAECRVLARQHAHLGEIPVAEIVLADASKEPSRKELVACCRERLPAYKIPREFRFVAALERTVTGKLQR